MLTTIKKNRMRVLVQLVMALELNVLVVVLIVLTVVKVGVREEKKPTQLRVGLLVLLPH